MTRPEGQLDSCVFQIVLHTFSQALRSTFIWGKAAPVFDSMCRLRMNLSSHPNIKSCSHYSHPSRWPIGVGLNSMSIRDSPGSHTDLSGQLLRLAEVLLSQTEEWHCTCVSAAILSLASPLRLKHKTTTDVKGV